MESRVFNKLAFFKSIGYEPHAGQLQVHQSTAPRRVLACGTRWGKSLCAAAEAIAAAMQPAQRALGWIAAPTYDLCDRVWKEIIVLVAEHLRHRIVTLKESERRLVLRNMSGGLSEIQGKSADNPISLLGAGLDFLIVDECARLKPAIWQSHLAQRLIDKNGWALFISTPRGRGWYYDLFRRGQGHDPDYESWNSPSWLNPHLNKEVIEQERARLPERVFRQELGAEFLEGSGSVLRYVRDCATGTWQEPDPNPDVMYYAGLDLAKVEDFTVLTIVNKRRQVVFVDRFHRLDWNIQLNRIGTAVRRYHDARILIDSTGCGEPIYEALRRSGCYADPYPFTQKSKAALIDNLSLLFEQKKIVLPRADLFAEGLEELEGFEFTVTDNGNVRMSAPSGMHDDIVISLALAMWQLRPSKPEPNIAWGEMRPDGKFIMHSTQSTEDDDDSSDHADMSNPAVALPSIQEMAMQPLVRWDVDDDESDLFPQPRPGDDPGDDNFLERLLRS